MHVRQAGGAAHMWIEYRRYYCWGQPESISPIVSCAAFISPTRSAGGLPAACIYMSCVSCNFTNKSNKIIIISYQLHPLYNILPILRLIIRIPLHLKPPHYLPYKPLLLFIPLQILRLSLSLILRHPVRELNM